MMFFCCFVSQPRVLAKTMLRVSQDGMCFKIGLLHCCGILQETDIYELILETVIFYFVLLIGIQSEGDGDRGS